LSKIFGTGKTNWQGNKNGNPIPLPKILLPPLFESVAESASAVITALIIAAAFRRAV
jgi:hypothetical protein